MATRSSSKPRPPERGDVIEFAFLFKHERDAGRLEAVKSRRCVVIAVLEGGRRVVVAPITGTEPTHANKMALRAGQVGLKRPSWIITDELNVTVWPGYDLRHAAAPSGAWWRHGRVSDAVRQRLADDIERLILGGSAKVVGRGED